MNGPSPRVRLAIDAGSVERCSPESLDTALVRNLSVSVRTSTRLDTPSPSNGDDDAPCPALRYAWPSSTASCVTTVRINVHGK